MFSIYVQSDSNKTLIFFYIKNISFVKNVEISDWSIVLNCGKPITIKDGTILEKFESVITNAR